MVPDMKKIEYAIGAAGVFIQHLHREGFDRGMIATFGDGFRIARNFTGHEADLHTTLRTVAREARDNHTRLYDSIADAIMAFWEYGKRDRPWLLIVITDGQDNISRKYPNPVSIGQFIGQRFEFEPSNFTFVIGVGEGNQIDRNALGRMGDAGGFPAVTIGAFPLLERVFLEIAIEISAQIEGRHIAAGNLSWDEVARIYRVSQTPIDYAFLIDCSASMNEQG